jgi:hypothetical protein
VPASASRSPPFSSGKVYLGRLSRSISRRVSSGVRARVMSLDSPPNGITFPCTPPFISWSMVCVGVLGLPGAAAFGGGAFPSALSSARAPWTAPSTAMADNMITACFIAPLLRKRKRPRQGSRLAFRPRTQGKGLPWIVGRQPEVRSKPTTRAGVAPPVVALITRCSIDRSDLKRPIDPSGARHPTGAARAPLSPIPVAVMPIPVVTTMLVRDIRVSAVPIARHAWRFGTACRLAKAVCIRGWVWTVIRQTLRH